MSFFLFKNNYDIRQDMRTRSFAWLTDKYTHGIYSHRNAL